jgi:predicted RNase H-like HicB family nuclease
MKNKTAEDYLKEPYARILTPDEDGGFLAEILEFEGCFTDGKTAVEALKNLDKVAKSWVELRLSKKISIPEPIARYEMSGKFALRLPQSLHSKAAIMAEKDGVSLNTFIVSAIATKVGAQDLFNRLLNELKSRLTQPVTVYMPPEYQLTISGEIKALRDKAVTPQQTGLARTT